jgi:glycosyltransferase involved in cell wall biosynthesis
MKILLLGRYSDLGASSRYRFYQYLPYLREQGFDITVSPFLDNAYIQRRYSGQRTSLLKVVLTYGQRISSLLQSDRYDLIWLEKEALPWIPPWLESLLYKSRVPYLVDYDDAIFHQYDQHPSSLIRSLLGKKIDRVMHKAAMVIAGNDYLATHAYQSGAKKVEVLPTVIDLERYPLVARSENEVFTIGWIGSPMTCGYLKEIQPALQKVCRDGKARVVAIGAKGLELEDVPLEIKPWSEATEVQNIQQFDVGIMPLSDSPFEWGKCGLKLIQYMGCACPVIGSPIGVNQKIIEPGINGFQASCQEEWVEAFQTLKNDPMLRKRMGEAGRVKVEEQYSLQAIAPKLAQLLREAKEITDVRYYWFLGQGSSKKY